MPDDGGCCPWCPNDYCRKPLPAIPPTPCQWLCDLYARKPLPPIPPTPCQWLPERLLPETADSGAAQLRAVVSLRAAEAEPAVAGGAGAAYWPSENRRGLSRFCGVLGAKWDCPLLPVGFWIGPTGHAWRGFARFRAPATASRNACLSAGRRSRRASERSAVEGGRPVA